MVILAKFVTKTRADKKMMKLLALLSQSSPLVASVIVILMPTTCYCFLPGTNSNCGIFFNR